MFRKAHRSKLSLILTGLMGLALTLAPLLSGTSQPAMADALTVQVFANSNFGGATQNFGVGVYLANQGHLNVVGNDAISSLKVPAGLKLVACQNEASPQGACATYEAGDVASVGGTYNDQFSYLEVTDVAPPPASVQVFANQNFGGATQSYGVGVYLANQGHLSVVGNDTISSLKVPAGLKLVACQREADPQGVCATYEAGDVAYVGSTYDNLFSYLNVTAVTPPPPSTVQVFANTNFTGATQSFGVGVYEANQGHLNVVGNDTISSLKVPAGLKLVACQNENAQGLCATYEAGDVATVSSQLNDQFSYLAVTTATPPPPPATVQVFANQNFAGATQSYGVGVYLANQGHLSVVGNDAISSLKVPAGLKLVACQRETDPQGACATYEAGDVAYVGSTYDNLFSYLNVTTATPPPPAHTTYYTDGKVLRDPQGAEVLVRGVEQVYWTASWLQNSFIDQIATTGANTVRVLPYYHKATPTGDPGSTLAAIEDSIRRGINGHMLVDVAIDGGTNADVYLEAPVLQMLLQYDSKIVIHAKGESYENTGAEWAANSKTIITKLRNAGYKAPLYILSTTGGRNLPVALQYGQEIVNHDPLKNIVIGWQAYWGSDNTYQNQYGMSLDTAMHQAASAAFPIQVGLGYRSDPDINPSATIPYSQLMSLAQNLRLGWLWWDWRMGVDQLTTDGTVNTKTTFGHAVIDNDPNSISHTSVRTPFQLGLHL
jgi:hypothetical protein